MTITATPGIAAKPGIRERLRLIWHLSKSEVLLFMREPTAMFFTLLFPLMLLIFVGVVYGETVDENGLRFIDIYFPTLMAAVAANLGVMGVTINIAEARSRGVLRRYKIAPFPFSSYMMSQIVVGLFMYALSAVSILVSVSWLYGFNLQGSLLKFLGILALGLAVMMTLGFLIGGLNITVRTSQLIGTVLFFFMFFGSGGAIPRSQFPQWMQTITEVNPLTHLSDSLIQVYLGRSLNDEIPGLIGLGFGFFVLLYLANRFFTWEVQP